MAEHRTYRVARADTGEWTLWADDEVLDVDSDPEVAPLPEILCWASDVISYDHGVNVAEWVADPAANGQALSFTARF